ncbi:hypothetical protein C4K68_19530 [Pokkaliibacter plantistimulans]|uniref:Type VI secretion protein n=1 Tax=Proteobacteria bacterium 228 TaxID=2083153 RepID=A0A2S5KMR1_9PROT|nr:PAAR domain-containing protein [Pokkaliibacter plantistimulans]PPC75596.1 hypothetical protein C4K68_19530 [Pokkaliibacter plantistimulans]
MGKPAATVGHFHTCPKYDGRTPHVGGPVVTGSPNVFINGMPAARVGDTLICCGPPDTIKEGSATVFINGMPAARMGDGTAHGGVIIGGSGNVLIGDSSYSGQAGPNPSLSESQAMTLRKPAPFCEECEKCKDGQCAIG